MLKKSQICGENYERNEVSVNNYCPITDKYIGFTHKECKSR